MEGIEGEHISSIAARPNGALIALTASGRIYEQYRTGQVLGDYAASRGGRCRSFLKRRSRLQALFPLVLNPPCPC